MNLVMVAITGLRGPVQLPFPFPISFLSVGSATPIHDLDLAINSPCTREFHHYLSLFFSI
jgi:hypothetical protein